MAKDKVGAGLWRRRGESQGLRGWGGGGSGFSRGVGREGDGGCATRIHPAKDKGAGSFGPCAEIPFHTGGSHRVRLPRSQDLVQRDSALVPGGF